MSTTLDRTPSTPVAPAPAETLRLRTALPALIVLTLAAVLTVAGTARPNVPAPHADVTRLPEKLGTWVMRDSEKKTPKTWALDDTTARNLSLDSYTQRVYQDVATGRYVVLLFEYRTLDRGAFNHRPEACYPASGYSLSDTQTVPITYGGREQKAVSLVADGDVKDMDGVVRHSHQALLYWFATGDRTESSFWKQQVEMALGKLHPATNGWAFVRLVAECPPGGEAGAEAAERDFAAQAAPDMIRLLGSPPRS